MPSPNRWWLAGAAIFMQVCLGIIYAWAVFRGPLEQAYGWSKPESVTPFRWSILALTFATIIAGLWQDRQGPRVVASTGGVLLGLGFWLTSFQLGSPLPAALAYGLIVGMGAGFAYVTPVALCVKWFPDRRGLVVGLAVMGFGLGSLLFAPLLEASIGHEVSRFRETVPAAMRILGTALSLCIVSAAQIYRLPPNGWRPSGWTPRSSSAVATRDFSPGQMLGTPVFYAVWALYFLGSSIGLTVLGEAAPLVRELAGPGAALTGGQALGLLSLFNGGGRLSWGAISDRFGRRPALLAMCVLASVVCGLVLPSAHSFWLVLVGLCGAVFAFGGFLSIMPNLCADYWGSRNIGANYGLLFTAWGTAGFVLPLWSSSVIGAAKAAGQVQAGYDQVFYLLAGLAVAGGLIAAVVKRPV